MSVEYAVSQRRETVAVAALPREVDLGDDAAAAARQAIEHPAPVVDDHTVAIGLAPVEVESRLRRRDDAAEILDCAGPQQGLPMRPPRRLRKGGRHGEELGTGSAQPAKELGK